MTPNPPKIADDLQRLAESNVLRELENRLAAQNAFNLFDAIGVSTQELRHSDFLAFLLRPHEAHGLGDTFLKWFLGHALANSPAPPISRDTLNQSDLSDAQVQREWNKVDLFITSAKNQLAVVVENKIYTGEHSDQLARYKGIAEGHGHGGPTKTLLCVYLTPSGGNSTHNDYLPLGYATICARLEALRRTGAFADAKSLDVHTVVEHYTRLLRRKIVCDPEITKLCREIYAEHQAAFDQVFKEFRNCDQSVDTERETVKVKRALRVLVALDQFIETGATVTEIASLLGETNKIIWETMIDLEKEFQVEKYGAKSVGVGRPAPMYRRAQI